MPLKKRRLVALSDKDVVMKSVTQEQWEKMRKKIWWVDEKVGVADEYALLETEENISETNTILDPVIISVIDSIHVQVIKSLDECPD